MLFVIRFTDHQDRKDVRRQNLAAHIDWLAQRRSSVLVAGSLRECEDQNPVGAIWIVEAPGREAAEAIYKTDPFWLAGLRKDVEVLHWCKAFPDQQVLV